MSQRFAQLKLPDPTGHDLHPWLLLDGCVVRAGSRHRALFPDGWHDITLEVNWEKFGPACWYISTPGYSDVSPVGLFVEV